MLGLQEEQLGRLRLARGIGVQWYQERGALFLLQAWPGIKSISGGPEPPSSGSIKPTGDGSLFSSICTIL
ncbi:hypothetical protein PanWU01x14_116010 [Parasponia andersonii]|uniref:Uncharacterized protein n=1 Tax=Parasponia andersonii TaxID=3476 RepID=A0A2P5CX18_PARAD|nr:hypothetical protein PanWU01x14_116010 [Parasponia andersonii]